MSNLSTVLPSVTGYDYVQPDQPTDPEIGETWFDTDTTDTQGQVYDGGGWVEESAPKAGFALVLSGGAYDLVESDISHGNISGSGAPDAHHSRPASTQNTGQATGRVSGFTYPRFSVSNAFDESGSLSMSYAVQIMAHTNEIQFSDDGFGGDAVIHYADGTSETITVPEATSSWHATNGEIVTFVEWSTNSMQVTGVNLVEVHGHNHGI